MKKGYGKRFKEWFNALEEGFRCHRNAVNNGRWISFSWRGWHRDDFTTSGAIRLYNKDADTNMLMIKIMIEDLTKISKFINEHKNNFSFADTKYIKAFIMDELNDDFGKRVNFNIIKNITNKKKGRV